MKRYRHATLALVEALPLRVRIAATATIVVLTVAILVWSLFLAPARPWERTGTLVVALRIVDTGAYEHALTLGVDNVAAHREASSRVLFRNALRVRMVAEDTSELIILANVRIPAGTYDALSVELRSPALTSKGTSSKALPGVRIPSPTLLLPVTYTVTRNETTAVILGLEELGNITSGAEHIWHPVVQVESRTGTVLERTVERAGTISGGTISSSRTYGMDDAGLMRLNYRAPVE